MIDIKEYKKEEEQLNYVSYEVEKKLDELGIKIVEDEEKYKEFQKMVWSDYNSFDNADISEAKMSAHEEKNKNLRKEEYFKKLYKIKNKPYFASIVFEDEDHEKFDVYISMTYLKNDNLENILYDWRSPICSLYYDFENGPCYYEAPAGRIEGNLIRKRQYKIEDNRLINVFDTSMNIDDEVLQEVLSNESNEKMKNVVNTIQKEQNKVIRDLENKHLIVQGIAGSGKTTVALHRIAFLLYRMENLKSSNILIFSPNNIFSEYISEVLPSLGEDNTKETTFHEYLSNFLNEYDSVEAFSDFIARYYKKEENNIELVTYKQSDQILKDLILYINDYESNAKFINDIDEELNFIPEEELNNYLHYKYDKFPLFERLDEIAVKLSEINYKGSHKKVATYRKLIKESINFTEDFKEIYRNFFKSKYCKINLSEIEISEFIDKDIVNYEDALLITFIKGKLEGYKTDLSIKEVVIDEAQDYNLLQYVIIKNIFKKASFTILGDINQNINPYYHYKSLEIIKNLFKDSSIYIELLKTYRSSPEIVEYSNKVLNLNHTNAIRNKTNKEVLFRRTTSNLKEQLEDDISYLEQNYSSVAIITKDDKEAEKLYKLLDNSNISLLENNDKRFSKDLVIVPAYIAKGLEFGGVIVYNDRENPYTKKERNLMYVAITRAQHELIIYN